MARQTRQFSTTRPLLAIRLFWKCRLRCSSTRPTFSLRNDSTTFQLPSHVFWGELDADISAAGLVLGNDEINANSLQTIGDCLSPSQQHLTSQAASIPFRDPSNLLKVASKLDFARFMKKDIGGRETKAKKTKWDKSVVVIFLEAKLHESPKTEKELREIEREELPHSEVGACISM